MTTLALALGAGVLAAGCAHTPSLLADQPDLKTAAGLIGAESREIARKSATWDATKRTLDGRSWLVASHEDRLRLELLEGRVGSGEFHGEAASVLESMLARGRAVHALGAEGMPREIGGAGADWDLLADAERGHLASRLTRREQEKWLRELRGELPPEEAVGGRAWRMLAGLPAVPFLYGWIAVHAATEDKGPYPHEFERARVYRATSPGDVVTAARLADADTEELLAFYAPVIVQDTPSDVDYDETVDMLGHPRVRRDERGGWRSDVDTTDPAVFTHVTRAYLAGEWHTQLNYTLWYPEHPPMGWFDPEAGSTEGVMLRLTLDHANQPLLMETAFSCGCFHRVFPVEALEKEGTETFGPRASGRSSLGRKQVLKVDPIIPQCMGTFHPSDPHPRVYLYGGKHFAGAVEFGGPLPDDRAEAAYRLVDATALEHLPSPDGVASFFGRDGLVRGADRPEAWMLLPTGFYHAGTPRIRGSHLIHFDQYSYDDPRLLEQLLRLPPAPYLSNIARSPYARPAVPSSGGAGPDAPVAPPPTSETEEPVQRAVKRGFFCPC
jgi:hypothetical protein